MEWNISGVVKFSEKTTETGFYPGSYIMNLIVRKSSRSHFYKKAYSNSYSRSFGMSLMASSQVECKKTKDAETKFFHSFD